MVKNAQKNETSSETEVTKSSHWKFKLFVILLLCVAIAGIYGYYRWWPLLKINTADFARKADVDKQITELNKRLEQITAQINSLQEQENNAVAAESSVNFDSDDMRNQFEQFKQEINAQLATLNIAATPDKKAKTPAPIIINKTPELLLASGAMIVRDMAESGSPFEYEAEVLQILAQHNEIAEKYVGEIQKYAVSGIKGREALIRSFNSFYPSLNEAPINKKIAPQSTETPPIENSSWQNKTWQWLKKMVTHPKKIKKPEFDTAKDEVYKLVNSGKLAEAINLLKTNDEYAKINSTVLTEWENQAQNYLNFDHAVNGLIMNSLANIRLKEMEH